MRRFSRSVLLALALAAPFAAGALPHVLAQQGRVDPSVYAGLRWRSIGPFRGGRVNGVSGVPGQPNTFYFGSVGGGVWKTTNAGRTWLPIFDSQPIASIGAIGVAPSNPNIVYVGTGEADMRSQISYGNGMYKSTDAGKSWTHIGLDNTRQIGRVLDALELVIRFFEDPFGIDPQAQQIAPDDDTVDRIAVPRRSSSHQEANFVFELFDAGGLIVETAHLPSNPPQSEAGGQPLQGHVERLDRVGITPQLQL
jgi:hypothetical protein